MALDISQGRRPDRKLRWGFAQGEILRRRAGATVKGCLRSGILVFFFLTTLWGGEGEVCAPADGVFTGDPTLIWSQVKEFVHLSPVSEEYKNVFGLFVPGENYIVGGALLGKAYSSVADRDCDLVIVVTSVPERTRGVFISSVRGFRTPVGYISSDLGAVKTILGACPEISLKNDSFPEQFWYQLPFIQYVLGSPSVIAVQVGEMDFPRMSSIAKKIAQVIGDRSPLVVFAGKLSVGKNDLRVASLDKNAIEFISQLDAQKLVELSGVFPDVDMPDIYGIVFAILMMSNLGAKKGDVLRHITTTGIPRKKYSGLVSAVFYDRKLSSKGRIALSPADGMALWELAKGIIFEHKVPRKIPRKLYRYHAGVFITLFDDDSIIAQTGDLFTNMNVVEAVAKYSKLLISPRRIPRVDVYALKNPSLSVSIAEPVDDVQLPSPDMGIYIRWGDKVIVAMPGEFGNFSPERRLEKTCLKGGIPSRGWCSPECEVYYFKVQSFSGVIGQNAQGD